MKLWKWVLFTIIVGLFASARPISGQPLGPYQIPPSSSVSQSASFHSKDLSRSHLDLSIALVQQQMNEKNSDSINQKIQQTRLEMKGLKVQLDRAEKEQSSVLIRGTAQIQMQRILYQEALMKLDEQINRAENLTRSERLNVINNGSTYYPVPVSALEGNLQNLLGQREAISTQAMQQTQLGYALLDQSSAEFENVKYKIGSQIEELQTEIKAMIEEKIKTETLLSVLQQELNNLLELRNEANR